MSHETDPLEVADALRVSVSLLVRRLRQRQRDCDLTDPETSALARLDRCGPTTPGALAKREQISAQSMGTTLAALEARGLIHRRPDPADGRRVVLSLTEAGGAALRDRRSARSQILASALAGLSADERHHLLVAAPLIERLAEGV
ncbi:MAG: MarR family winged helix-turn-helix transcriptional regulator [Acidimicrobiales bacterium]